MGEGGVPAVAGFEQWRPRPTGSCNADVRGFFTAEGAEVRAQLPLTISISLR